jgi:hypothetical protein
LLRKKNILLSVADPGCLSRILIFIIPDPLSNNSNKRGEVKKCVVQLVLPSLTDKYHKIENNYFTFELEKERIYKEL